MNGTLKIDHINKKLIMDSKFAKAQANVGSYEYNWLLDAHNNYPNYEIIQKTIKKNSKKRTYKGLKYEFIEKYIRLCGNAEENYEVYKTLRLLSECNGSKYQTVRAWFFQTYPEVEAYADGNFEKILEIISAREDKKSSENVAA